MPITHLPPKYHYMYILMPYTSRAQTSAGALKLRNILYWRHAQKDSSMPNTLPPVHIFWQPSWNDDVMHRGWSNGSADGWTFSTCAQIDTITFTLHAPEGCFHNIKAIYKSRIQLSELIDVDLGSRLVGRSPTDVRWLDSAQLDLGRELVIEIENFGCAKGVYHAFGGRYTPLVPQCHD